MADSSDVRSAGPARAVRCVGIALLLGAALALAACGGGGGDAASSDGPTVPPVSDTEVPAESDAGSLEVAVDPGQDVGAPDPAGLGGMQAVVVIGDELFEFEMSTACLSMGGAVGGSGFAADGSVRIEIDIPPEDWETSTDGWDAPSIRIDDKRDGVVQPDWRAGGEVIATNEDLVGVARVDTFSVEGSRASGSATFVDLTAYFLALANGDPLPDPVAGTFEINCG